MLEVRLLVRAVIMQALKDIANYLWLENARPTRKTKAQKRVAVETREAGLDAIEWISDSSHEPWSFLWCCEISAVNAKLILRQIAEKPASFARQMRGIKDVEIDERPEVFG